MVLYGFVADVFVFYLWSQFQGADSHLDQNDVGNLLLQHSKKSIAMNPFSTGEPSVPGNGDGVLDVNEFERCLENIGL